MIEYTVERTNTQTGARMYAANRACTQWTPNPCASVAWGGETVNRIVKRLRRRCRGAAQPFHAGPRYIYIYNRVAFDVAGNRITGP